MEDGTEIDMKHKQGVLEHHISNHDGRQTVLHISYEGAAHLENSQMRRSWKASCGRWKNHSSQSLRRGELTDQTIYSARYPRIRIVRDKKAGDYS